MEKLELEYNDYVYNIFVFTIRNNCKQYYFSSKDKWFMDHWVYLYNDKKLDYISEMLEVLSEDIVSVESLKKEFKRLNRKGKQFVIECHYPMLYVDFDSKVLKSRYFERSLHDRIPNDWTGKYKDFLNEIPPEFRYWEIKEST